MCVLCAVCACAYTRAKENTQLKRTTYNAMTATPQTQTEKKKRKNERNESKTTRRINTARNSNKNEEKTAATTTEQQQLSTCGDHRVQAHTHKS